MDVSMAIRLCLCMLAWLRNILLKPILVTKYIVKTYLLFIKLRHKFACAFNCSSNNNTTILYTPVLAYCWCLAEANSARHSRDRILLMSAWFFVRGDWYLLTKYFSETTRWLAWCCGSCRQNNHTSNQTVRILTNALSNQLLKSTAITTFTASPPNQKLAVRKLLSMINDEILDPKNRCRLRRFF